MKRPADRVPTRGEPAGDADPGARLRPFTPARIGLGRTGASLPTRALLDFELAHAQARDAVHASLDTDALAQELQAAGGLQGALVVRSQARDRTAYLLRPDLGRSLDVESRERLSALAQNRPGSPLAIVIADGLSAIAPQHHAVPLLGSLRAELPLEDAALVIATQARVALGDEIGELLKADAVLVLIGERPGLSSPDSLGAYLTWAPRVGRTDAERNCISNIRSEGLPYAEAARRIAWLLHQARRLQASGIALKDDSGQEPVLDTHAAGASVEQAEELDRRMAAYDKDPTAVIPWEQVRLGQPKK